MNTINRDNADRLSVADAKRLILDALPHETSGEVYARINENGEVDFEGPIELREVHGVQIYASFMDCDFLPMCEQLSIQPRMKYRPAFTNYKNATEDDYYTIAHDEFVKYAELFSLSVAVGGTPKQARTGAENSKPVQRSAAPEPQVAPVVATMKKQTLINTLEYEWPTICKDISEATRNGLKNAAHAKHSIWDMDKARAWAVSKGKIKQAAPLHNLAAVWTGTVTRHTIGDE